jgi:hypothetical protein
VPVVHVVALKNPLVLSKGGQLLLPDMSVSSIALKEDALVFFSPDTDLDDDANHLASVNFMGTNGQVVLKGYQGAVTARLSGIASPEAPADALAAGYPTCKTAVRFASEGHITLISTPTTLTGFGFGALVLGSSSPALGDRVLIKDQETFRQNGIYQVTVVGDDDESFVLTRTHDFQAGCTVLGATVVVREGTYAGQMFVARGDDTSVLVGTDAIHFSLLRVDVNALAGVDTDDGGRLVYFLHNDGEADDGTAQTLALGSPGYPLVAGASNPEYAQLTGAGIADGTITGVKLETGIYKDQLTIGNSEEDEYISFGSAGDFEGVAHAVQVYVGGEPRLSATTAGGSFVGTWSGSSDERWKDLLGPVSTDALADLDKVRSESWTWKPGFHFQAGTFGAGVTAQQFQQVCPRAVTYSAEQGGLVVDYHAVQSFEIACLKALKEENMARKAEVADLKQANAALSEAVAALTAANAALAAANAALDTRVVALEQVHVTFAVL